MGVLKKKYADPATCEHKRTKVIPPQTGVSLHEREVCRDCGKIVRNEQLSHHRTKTSVKEKIKKKFRLFK